jgi:hypothetical protein
MEDTSVFTEARSKTVTSPTSVTSVKSPAQRSTKDGQKSVTSASAKFQEEAELIKDALSVAKDLLHKWSSLMPDGRMPQPLISSKYGVLTIALPVVGHVIENAVTSDGKHDFRVDGQPLIPDVTETDVTEPVTSEEK